MIDQGHAQRPTKLHRLDVLANHFSIGNWQRSQPIAYRFRAAFGLEEANIKNGLPLNRSSVSILVRLPINNSGDLCSPSLPAQNADILIDFLRRLIKGASTKLLLILDNLRVHPTVSLALSLSTCYFPEN